MQPHIAMRNIVAVRCNCVTMKTFAKHSFLIIIFLILQLCNQPLVAQKKNVGALVTIEIVPDDPDWTYNVGEQAHFTVRVIRANVPLTHVELTYEIGPEKMPPVVTGSSDMSAGVLQVDGGTMNNPGFMTCACEAVVDGVTYSNYLNVAFSPYDIQPTQSCPDDFDDFWEKSLKKAAKIPLEPLVTLVPERCTSRTDVYHVRLQHYRKDTYLYGWLCVPKKAGRYAAVLCVPGAGVKPVPPEIELAEQGNGMITFAIGVNGIPLNLDKEVYDNLRYGVLRDYGFIHLDDKERYYYHRIYTGCVRAIDFITTLDSYDGSNLGVMGGSQGGALSIVTAALDKRVKALVAFYPALCDVTGYLYGRAGGWPHIFAPKHRHINNTPEKLSTMQYYDVVNFARRLQVPGYYSWGYNDPTCPPTSLFAAYNVITAPRHLYVVQATGHWRFPEQNVVTLGWLYEFLTTSN